MKKLNVKNILLLFAFVAPLLVVGADFSSVRAESVEEALDSCFYDENAVVIYGQRVCPDKFNKDDEFAKWNKMRGNLEKILPDAFGEEVKEPPALCEHVKVLKGKYDVDAEDFIFKLQDSLSAGGAGNPEILEFIKRYKAEISDDEPDAPLDLFILKILNNKDAYQKMLSFYSEMDQIKIRMVKNTLEITKDLTVLYDSVLDTCPDYAKEKAYYKALNYNGPDAGYDPNAPGEAEKWEALKKQWAANKAKEAEESEETQE